MAVLVTAIHAVPHAAVPPGLGAMVAGWLLPPVVPFPRHGVDDRDKPGHDEEGEG